MKAIAVPERVARVKITVAAQVVEIVTEQTADQTGERRMIKQGAEPFPLVDKGDNHRAFRAVMHNAAIAKDRLKLCRDPADLFFDQTRQDQIAEGRKKLFLLRRNCHWVTRFLRCVQGTRIGRI
jgi:hypothetical protein